MPKIDVQVSGVFFSVPGPLIQANYIVPGPVAKQALGGRDLSGGAPNITVNLVSPGAMYGERQYEFDLSVGKILRTGGASRTSLRLDVYNALNRDTPVTLNNSFAVWQTPTDIVPARFAKVTVNFDF